MFWSNIGLIIISAVNLVLAFVIWLRNQKNKINIYFALSLSGVAFWGITESLMLMAKNPAHVLFWGIGAYVFSFFVATNFLIFSFYFPFINYKLVKKINLFLYLIFFAVTIVLIQPGLLGKKGIIGSNYNKLELNEISYWLYFILFIFYFGWSFYNLIIKYIRGEGFNKKQLGYIIVGTITVFLFATIFDLLTPYFKGEVLGYIGSYSTIILIFTISCLLFSRR